MPVDAEPDVPHELADPPDLGGTVVDGFVIGRALRIAAAALPADEAQQVLDRIQQLETEEHRTDDGALSAEERQQLWSLRAALAGRPDPGSERWAAIERHWSWLVENAPDPTGPGTAADLLRTAQRRPAPKGVVEQALAVEADALGVPDGGAAIARLRGLLASLGVDHRSPSLRDSTRAAHALATVAGLPRTLVDLHQDAAAARLAQLTASVTHAHLADLETGGQEMPGADEPGRDPAPRLAGAASAPHLVLAEPELTALHHDILDHADGREIDRLRLGAAPDPHSLLGAAVLHWQQRTAAEDPAARAGGERRTSARLREARRLLKEEPATAPATALDAAYLELDRGYRAAMYAVHVTDRAEALPLDVYTTVQRDTMTGAHVTAGFNYLRGLLTSHTLGGMHDRPASLLTAIRQVTGHMGRTAPDRWGGHERGRTDRRAHMGAVCLVAQRELDRTQLTSRREVVDLLLALRPTVDIATIGALTSWLRRERLQAAERKADAPRSDVWHGSVRRAVDHLTACGERVATDPHAGSCAHDAAGKVEEIGMLLGELAPQPADRDLAPLIARLDTLTARLRAGTVAS